MLIDIFEWSCGVNASLSLAMASVALFSRPMTRVKLYWGITCLSIAAWAVGTGIMASDSEYATAVLGQRICNASSIALTVLLFHTMWAVLGRTSRKPLVFAYGTAAVLFVSNAFGCLSTLAPAPPFRWYNSRLWPYDFFVAYFYFIFLSIVWILWRESRLASNPLRSRQLFIMMVGVGLGFLGGQTTVPLVYGIHFFPIGVLFVPLYLIFIGYGMLRYQLLDFRFVLRRIALAGIIYLTIAAVLLPIGWPLLKSISTMRTVPVPLLVLSLIAGVMLSLGPLIYSLLVKKSFWLRAHLSIGLTHELRSPLHAIQSAVAVLRDNMKDKPIDPILLGDYLEMIDRNAARLDRFSTDLLTVAREDGSQDLQLKHCDLVTLAERAVDEHRTNADLKGLALQIRSLAPARVKADEGKISQALSNIVSNAIRFSDAGKIDVEISRFGNECRVSVKDEGTGIENGQLLRIFNRFYQLDGKRGGTGLGLTIAKGWIEAHGGRIWAESAGLGKGTTVTFTLPSEGPLVG